jgi:hypothetical protein
MDGQLLQSKWNQRLLPVLNGVLSSDGRLVKMSVRHWLGPDRSIRAGLQQEGEGVVDFAEAQLQWVHAGIYAELLLAGAQYQAVCGDGGLDGDGFVALVDVPSMNLIWLAFFEDSGGFLKLEEIGPEIRATATDGLVWSFPVATPQAAYIAPPVDPAPRGTGLPTRPASA